MLHFVLTVVIVGLICFFTTPKTGFFNQMRPLFGLESLNFMILPEWFRTLFFESGIWQEVGWGSIIYLAALSGIDPQLYEAPKVDGANELQIRQK